MEMIIKYGILLRLDVMNNKIHVKSSISGIYGEILYILLVINHFFYNFVYFYFITYNETILYIYFRSHPSMTFIRHISYIIFVFIMSWGNQGQGWGNQGNQGWGNQGQQGWGNQGQQGWGQQGPPQQGWGQQGQQGWGQGQQGWGQGQQGWGQQGPPQQGWGQQGPPQQGWGQQGQGWGNQQDYFHPQM